MRPRARSAHTVLRLFVARQGALTEARSSGVVEQVLEKKFSGRLGRDRGDGPQFTDILGGARSPIL